MTDPRTPDHGTDPREEARRALVSRRRVVKAGLALIPVVVTLDAVPARAAFNANAMSSKNMSGPPGPGQSKNPKQKVDWESTNPSEGIGGFEDLPETWKGTPGGTLPPISGSQGKPGKP